MTSKITPFLKESRGELKKVNWPSREETIRFTLFVIVFSLALSALLGFLDFIFFNILELLVL